MEPVILISTIIFFILSLASSLILAIASPRLNPKILKGIIIFHLVLLIPVLFSYPADYGNHLQQFIILTFYCTALLSSGWVLRSKFHPVFKIYSSFYLIYSLLFFYFPSLLFYSMSGNIKRYPETIEFKVKDNYFLSGQHSLLNLDEGHTKFKLIQKLGLFNKTIYRDIDFGIKIDTVITLDFTPDTVILQGINHNTGETVKTGFRPGIQKNKITSGKTN